ncbi:hypothetical protein FACS189446_0780 [Bacteroidia bacterium]|nr:hypothetical protein FACS189446_0780 [Bacteroidia bacterium]
MGICWQSGARKAVKKIYFFYKSKNETVAKEIIDEINDAVERLALFPQSAPIEPILEGHPKAFRALLIMKLFKVIYYINEAENEVVIVTVWDCRQNPEKLADLVK